VLIADARQPLTRLDRQLLEWHAPSGQPVLVLLTKADKLSRTEATGSLKAAEQVVRELHPEASIQLFSAVSAIGQRQAERQVAAWLAHP
jgi:GTP-binding protein